MKLCQFEFQFQNEYMSILEEKIGEVFDIEEDNMLRKDVAEQSFILRMKDINNFMFFSARKSSYIYLLILVCEEKYEDDIRNVLMELCDEMEEDYDEDHRHEVRNVFGEKTTRFAELEANYNIKELFGL